MKNTQSQPEFQFPVEKIPVQETFDQTQARLAQEHNVLRLDLITQDEKGNWLISGMTPEAYDDLFSDEKTDRRGGPSYTN